MIKVKILREAIDPNGLTKMESIGEITDPTDAFIQMIRDLDEQYVADREEIDPKRIDIGKLSAAMTLLFEAIGE